MKEEEATAASQGQDMAILDALASPVAMLDASGTVLHVNRAWATFARDNGGRQSLASGAGTNFLEVCGSAQGAWAEEAPTALGGISAVLTGEESVFELEYPCHSTTEKRWFVMTVTPLFLGKPEPWFCIRTSPNESALSFGRPVLIRSSNSRSTRFLFLMPKHCGSFE